MHSDRMRRLTSLILVVLLCLPARLTRAAGCESVPSLSTPGKEYVVSTVTVPVGCKLKLRAGVTVKFKAGARLRVLGSLEVAGLPGSPVTLTSASSGAPWKGMVGEAGAGVEVSNLVVTGSSEGLQFSDPPSVFRGVHMLDNIRNTISVGTGGFRYERNYVFQDIWFENRDADAAMLETGMTFNGIDHLLTVDGVHFQAKQRGVGFVKAVGASKFVSYNNVTFSGCESKTVIVYQHEYGLIPKENCLQKELPILFIPGYGTSIHLGAMSHPPNPGEVIHNLHFIGKLTPGYTDFLKALDDAHATYEVAYYDWRQPAEVILKSYILPALARLKRKAGSRYVNVVAHSYGGILSRAYIQGAGYLGDVHSLVQVGTPNAGAVKAYPLWQAGVLPKDWAAVGSLMRLYGKGIPESPAKNHDVIHSNFSSVQDLQPVYPALKRGRSFLIPSEMAYANTRLLKLNASIPELHKRVSVATVVSEGENTPTWTLVQPVKDQDIWPDGEMLGEITSLSNGGDGTVPIQSSPLEGADVLKASGKHQDLPGTGAGVILKYLAEIFQQPKPPLPYKKVILFSIDCPVDVTVTGSNGYRATTTESNEAGEGDVEVSPEMQWFLLPDEPGVTYNAAITALEDTAVRYWLDTDSIHTFVMKKGEKQDIPLKLEEVTPAGSDSNGAQVVTSSDTTRDAQLSKGFALVFTPNYLETKLQTYASHAAEATTLQKQDVPRLTITTKLKRALRLDTQKILTLGRIASILNPIFGITASYLVQLE